MSERIQYGRATTNINDAMMTLMHAVENGHNAWIEVEENGKQKFPVLMKNPALDDIRNWQFSYGVPRRTKELENYHYFNDMEKDLTYHYSNKWADSKEDIDLYYDHGIVTEKILRNGGAVNLAVAVSNKDINRYRESQEKSVIFDFWVSHWKPKEGIQYWIPKPLIEVFVVYHDEHEQLPYAQSKLLLKAADFLKDYANMKMKQEE